MRKSNTDARRQPQFGRIRKIHMVGIGGIGMSSIAEVLLARGYVVTGSDLQKTEVTSLLETKGAVIYSGHDAAHVREADVVVYSSAVEPTENPETRFAESRRIPLIPRSVMLGELVRMKYGIGIAGTHGKTTTTSMAGMVVSAGGFDPTIIVGGRVSVFGSNAVSGAGDVIVVEADEYARTFLRIAPALAVITNIEEEHLDVYQDLDDLKSAFVQYANSVPFFGAVLACLDDGNVQSILGDIDRRIVTFGYARQAHVRADAVEQDGHRMHFDVYHHAMRLGRISLNVPGHHNVRNALAAIAIGLELDMPFETICAGLNAFGGVQRRMETIGDVRGVLVVDDYAHHPTEVRATLEASSACWPSRRIVAVFQPHLYSRTAAFYREFAHAFLSADVLIVTDVYGAREERIESVDGSLIAEAARMYGHRNVHYVRDLDDVSGYTADLVAESDVVLIMGAGDIWRQGRRLLERLQETAEVKK